MRTVAIILLPIAAAAAALDGHWVLAAAGLAVCVAAVFVRVT